MKIFLGYTLILLGVLEIIYVIIDTWKDAKEDSVGLRIFSVIVEMLPDPGRGAMYGYLMILLGLSLILF